GIRPGAARDRPARHGGRTANERWFPQTRARPGRPGGRPGPARRSTSRGGRAVRCAGRGGADACGESVGKTEKKPSVSEVPASLYEKGARFAAWTWTMLRVPSRRPGQEKRRGHGPRRRGMAGRAAGRAPCPVHQDAAFPGFACFLCIFVTWAWPAGDLAWCEDIFLPACCEADCAAGAPAAKEGAVARPRAAAEQATRKAMRERVVMTSTPENARAPLCPGRWRTTWNSELHAGTEVLCVPFGMCNDVF